MKRKLVSIICVSVLSFSMCFGLTACGAAAENPADEVIEETEEVEPAEEEEKVEEVVEEAKEDKEEALDTKEEEPKEEDVKEEVTPSPTPSETPKAEEPKKEETKEDDKANDALEQLQELAGETETVPEAPADGEKVEVSREYFEDCGEDTGYWAITYSDGSVEYIDD